MHALTHNSTCACQPSGCGGGLEAAGTAHRTGSDDGRAGAAVVKYLVIGDSISEGIQGKLAYDLQPDGWELFHNPGNGDNTNYGAHCISTWTSASVYDVISFQFGLHDIAADEERLSVSQYIYKMPVVHSLSDSAVDPQVINPLQVHRAAHKHHGASGRRAEAARDKAALGEDHAGTDGEDIRHTGSDLHKDPSCGFLE